MTVDSTLAELIADGHAVIILCADGSLHLILLPGDDAADIPIHCRLAIEAAHRIKEDSDEMIAAFEDRFDERDTWETVQ